MWIARDEYGVSLHRTEPELEAIADDEGDTDEWSSVDCFQPNVLSDAGMWLLAELGKDIPVPGKARVRLVLGEPDMPLFGLLGGSIDER